MGKRILLEILKRDEFVLNGFIKIENAFSKELAKEGREILWRDLGCDPNNPETWNKPVIRLGDYSQEPFRKAVNSPILLRAFDQLVGKGRWLPRNSLGTFPVRFPSPDDPGDTGWHAEVSFQGDDGTWRLNINSKGRALLMLFLFSDVGYDYAPTRILVGSHLEVPGLLKDAGEEGLSFLELSEKFGQNILEKRVELATGEAGTVFLCHPFLIHAAQPHKGTNPRFMAQPPLYPAKDLMFFRRKGNYSAVEKAIHIGLGLELD
jgi:hypothetical protein